MGDYEQTSQYVLLADDITVCKIHSFSSGQLAAACTVADNVFKWGAIVLSNRMFLTWPIFCF